MVNWAAVTAHAKENWPPLVLRAIDWLSSLIVWATIVNKGQMHDACWFGRDNRSPSGSKSTCQFAVTTGVLTWLWECFVLALIMAPAVWPRLTIPAFFPGLSLVVSFVLAWFWLGNSMNLAVKYEMTCVHFEDEDRSCSEVAHQTPMLGALFFSWLCLVIWVFSLFIAWRRYRAGVGGGSSGGGGGNGARAVNNTGASRYADVGSGGSDFDDDGGGVGDGGDAEAGGLMAPHFSDDVGVDDDDGIR